jgi:hypothetical protein
MVINDPAAVAELTAAFFRFEAALVSHDVATLNELYWRNPLTVRYGVYENLYGYDMIAAFRQARLPRDAARTLKNTVITTFGRDFGVANTEFVMHGSDRAGRHTHTWIRTDEGWRIVSAHISWLTAPPVSPTATR